MKRGFFSLTVPLLLAGCAAVQDGVFGPPAPAPEPAPQVRDGGGQTHPRARPDTGMSGAATPDTGMAEAQGPAFLGVTIASLGAVSEPGMWLRTPLVAAPTEGRVEYPAQGTAVAVELRPLDAAPGAGSRISLAAMRQLEADLTDLPELRVYRGG